MWTTVNRLFSYNFIILFLFLDTIKIQEKKVLKDEN